MVKYKSRLAAVLSAGILTAGCAAKPIPDTNIILANTKYANPPLEDRNSQIGAKFNFENPNTIYTATYKIVKHIRCESQRSIVRILAEYLKNHGNEGDKKIADKFLGDEDYDLDVEKKKISWNIRKLGDEFQNAAVAYDFSLNGTEVNNISATFNLLRLFDHSILKLGAIPSNDRSRSNTRNFIMSDTFEDMLTEKFRNYCRNEIYSVNLVYPISGEIGMIEFFASFFEINKYGNLKENDKSLKTFADTLEFKTAFGLGVNPNITLLNSSPATRLTDASGTTSFSRSENHKLIVTVSLPKDVEQDTAKGTRIVRLSATQAAEDELRRQQNRFVDDALRDLTIRSTGGFR
ncbi:hypothetical protein [Methylopila sp. M107]|uniref:hypothetical protein n=1 Tax=Methylopila sp. M107 TaxID=1101190 RepID=UPI00039DCD3E|nr:hypothetical protein [Methylopila sp. M107]